MPSCSSISCESVLRALTSRYVYGFTANPKRGDGQDKKIFMQLGPVRHRYTALERAEKQGIGHYVYPRFTRVVDVSEELCISDAFSLVAGSEMRNLQIVSDAVKCVKMGQTPIAMPISFESNVEQYAGRLNRDYEGKKDVIIFDYIDQYVPILERMYHKRLKTYKRIGFEICSQVVDRQDVRNSIFDWQGYSEVFDADVTSSKTEVVVSSPGLGSRKVCNVW